MNSISRGMRNAFRNSIRTVSIVLILGLSIGLVIAMLAARQAVSDKIESVKSSTGNSISISPAGVRGFDGGGEALTADQLAKVASVSHVTKVVTTLNDRMSSDTTTLLSAIEPGSFGQRQADNSGVAVAPPADMPAQNSTNSDSTSSGTSTRTFTMPVMVTGVSDASAIAAGSGTVTWKSGAAFDASKDENIAVIGSAIATKNNLAVGSTFTAYSTSIKVVGIYDTSNTFGNNGVYFPLSALQRLSAQTGSITAATATVDSSDNLAAATTDIKTTLGTAADVTNSQDVADATVKPLESVKNISTFSMIGAVVAGAVVILLTMMMIVRERRREVGVMKAIGASNLVIMWQFVVEALTLTTIGLVLGFGIGIAAATPITNSLVESSATSTASTQSANTQRAPGLRGFGRTTQQTLTNITASIGAPILASGVFAALLIAVLGSAIPSLIISKIKPAEAMRSE